MTTLTPRSPYTDQELGKLYPSSLQLRSVQVLLRHGERTPVNARFRNAGLSASWPYCQEAKQLRAVILSGDHTWTDLEWRRRLETFGSNDKPDLLKGPQGEIDGICEFGELTDRGRETTLALGQRLRSLYVDQLKFLPTTIEVGNESSVSLRATPVPRALQSVQQAFTGLYPAGSRAIGAEIPAVVQRSFQNETLFPNEGACKRYAELFHAFSDRAAQRWNSSSEMSYINSKIGKWMPKESPKVQVDSHPRLSGVMDTINATLAHGPSTKLPKEFYDQKLLENIDRIAVEEWFAGFEESNEVRTLGIGAVIGDVTQRMVEGIRGVPAEGNDAPSKIHLAGCHDTTLAAALTALGGFTTKQNRWPNFTSSIAFELFQARADGEAAAEGSSHNTSARSWWSTMFSRGTPVKDDARAPLSTMSDRSKQELAGHYVRIRYNDAPVTLPYCQQPGRHLEGDESFCTLTAFKEAADSMTPRNWKAECKQNLGTPAFPVTKQPPLGMV